MNACILNDKKKVWRDGDYHQEKRMVFYGYKGLTAFINRTKQTRNCGALLIIITSQIRFIAGNRNNYY